MAKNSRLSHDERQRLIKITGLDELREFIPDDDFTDALIEHAAAGLSKEQLDSEDEYLSPTREGMINNSRAVMKYLRDNGHSFSVLPDSRDGQLKVKLETSNIEVRVMDTEDKAQYVGRVYNDGITYAFSKGANSGGKNQQSDAIDNITPDMAVDLVKYGLGEDVKRRMYTDAEHQHSVDDKKVGAAQRNRFGVDPENYQPKSNGGFSALYETRTPSKIGTRNVSNNIYIKATDERKSTVMRFDTENGLDDAELYVKNSMENAEAAFTSRLKLEAVDVLAQLSVAGEFEGEPEFSGDPRIADMQKAYYDTRKEIYSDKAAYPDAAAIDNAKFVQDEATRNQVSEMFGNQSLKTINPVAVASYMDESKGLLTNEANLLSALKKINNSDNPSYDIEGDDFASNYFKERMVAYNPNPTTIGGKTYPMDINPNGPDADKMSPFWKEMGKSVYDGLEGMGVQVKSIHVDENGVIHYEGGRTQGTFSGKSKPEWTDVVGDIGQVFEPETNDYVLDENGNPTGERNLTKGFLRTNFNSDENYYIAPGYTAYVEPPSEEKGTEGQSYIERTRLRGYPQIMSDKIKATIRHDLASEGVDGYYDNTAGLNGVYHHLYGDKKSLDFIDKMRETGTPDDVIEAINKTSLQRVKYDKHYGSDTNILAVQKAELKKDKAMRGHDVYLDDVGANIAFMDHSLSKNVFDPYATSTGTNQGLVRYLVDGATVNPDGTINKGDSEYCNLINHDNFKYTREGNNPNDRVLMAFVNAMNQSSTAIGRTVNPEGEEIEPIGVGMAHMSLGGYTQDDAFVVSKDFADSCMIRGDDGNLRPLKIGDKICDHSGNKGVISFIADRNADMSYYEPQPIAEGMSVEEIKAIEKKNDALEQQRKIIELFKDNPSLDIVGAPYTAPSRFNGGTSREMIASQEKAKACGMPTDLIVDGKVYAGSIGYAKIIVTDMPVDVKTHIYGSESRVKEAMNEEAEKRQENDGFDLGETSGGRKASGQMVWGLAEMNASGVIREIYGNNESPLVKAREMMLAVGLDVDETGKLHRGYKPHQIGVDDNNQPIYEERNNISVRGIYNDCRSSEVPGSVGVKEIKDRFTESLGEDGGFMKIPFPIKMATGDMTPEILDENGNGTGEYRLPVLSGKFRSGRETVDNQLISHDYTARYNEIFNQSIEYLKNEDKANHANPEDGNYHYMYRGEDRVLSQSALQDKMNKAQASAQKAYDAIADDIKERQFTGKHNVWKDDVMRKELKGTSTAVISPDPTLDLNEVRMSVKMAIGLGLVKENTNIEEFNKNAKLDDKIVVGWRDPLLSGGGERSFIVNIVEDRPGHPGYDPNNPNNGLVGIQINPSAATSFEGDFDGDSMGFYKPKGKAAIRDCKEKLSHWAQILNNEMGNPGERKPYFQDGLDVAAGVYRDAEKGGDVKVRMEEAEKLMNLADMLGDKRVTPGSGNYRAFEMYNAAMHDAHREAFGHDVISYENPQKHIESLFSMTEEGAKGSIDKLKKGYAPYFGCEFEVDENNKIISFKDAESYATPEARQASMAAGHAKAVLTGVAGKFSQHAEMLALNYEPKTSKEKFDFAERKDLNNVMTLIEHGYKVQPKQKDVQVDEIIDGKRTGNTVTKTINSWEPVVARDEKGEVIRDNQGKPTYEKEDYFKTVTDENGKTKRVVNENALPVINAVRQKSDEMGANGTFSASAAATALTHPVTQSVMQLKHDTGPEILHKISMIQEVAPALWAGHKIGRVPDNDTGELKWQVLTERNPENGRYEPQPASPAEWKKMMKDFYEAKDGLNVGTPNPEHVNTMAEIMTVKAPNGKEYIEGFDTKTKKVLETETALTRLAYEGNFDTLIEYADKNANLFEGKTNSYIAPKVVNDNIRELNASMADPTYVPQFKGFAAKDTRCKDGVVDRPSVDVVDEVMKQGTVHIKVEDDYSIDDITVNNKPDYDVTENVQLNQSNNAPARTYADLSVEEQLDVMRAVAKKKVDGTISKDNCSSIEAEAVHLYATQLAQYKELGSKERVMEYESENPNAFKELRTIKKFIDVERNVPSLDRLSDEEYKKVAMSVASAYSNRKDTAQPVFGTANEELFHERLKKQDAQLAGLSANEKQQAIAENPAAFRERIACRNAFNIIEQQNTNVSVTQTPVSSSQRLNDAIRNLMSEEDASKIKAAQAEQDNIAKK